ncbi:unnamed protein product, partial [Lymnaea stagnalis]
MESLENTQKLSGYQGNSNVTSSHTSSPLATAAGLLSDHATQIFFIVNYVVLSTVISLVGIVANSLNICVLVRQGFSNSMNISFMGMAVSDMASLVTLLWLNVCLCPFLDGVFNEIHYLFGAWLHGCAARITGWITVYITIERYLSIARPLRVKQMVTPRRTALTVAGIYAVNLFTLVPEVLTVYLDWNMFSGPTLHAMHNLGSSVGSLTVEGLVFAVHAALTMLAFVALAIFTIVLVIKLKENATWRKKVTSDRNQTESISARDRKVVKLIITVATLLIVCYVPTVTLSIVSCSVPAFSLIGKESNIFYVAWSFAFITHSINSSVIVVLYVKMSSRYRQTFSIMF